jgi:hypothetical protein
LHHLIVSREQSIHRRVLQRLEIARLDVELRENGGASLASGSRRVPLPEIVPADDERSRGGRNRFSRLVSAA